ncbi:5232_t:CDS:2, partial [Racocetra persica]
EEDLHELKKNEVKNFEVNKTSDIELLDQISKITHTPYKNSFASRLYGNPRLATTLTVEEAWTSPFCRKLRPYIRRDYETKPPKLCLLQEIVKYAYRNEPDWLPPPSSPIDFCYFQKEHLSQVNDLLQRCFWPSIDDFSVVAMYKRLVIGCGFMTPEAYITYIAVAPGWEKSGIGQFMLYHLIQTNLGKDVTLHVSANNPAMILYQKFGFKPEEFIVNFYDKYLPDGSLGCKNAFFVTDFVLEWAQQNKTLPAYLKVNDVICQRCYNGIVVRPSAVMKEHAQSAGIEDYPDTVVDTQEDILKVMSFSNVIKFITEVLYRYEVTQKLLAFRTFEEFRTCIEAKDRHLKAFFDELVLSANLPQKK